MSGPRRGSGGVGARTLRGERTLGGGGDAESPLGPLLALAELGAAAVKCSPRPGSSGAACDILHMVCVPAAGTSIHLPRLGGVSPAEVDSGGAGPGPPIPGAALPRHRRDPQPKERCCILAALALNGSANGT